ncbi:MAG TPA: hypothetical protein VMW16_11340 [Sedimentisphaerales bacterium]|nr:hypothetical protein [Sedimentisphaerales bacterium]
MRKVCLSVCINLLLFSGCGLTDPGKMFEGKTTQKSQLEIRQMQTREYETSNPTLVMKAMLNVLQDEDFMVKQANTDLGFFSASKEIDSEDTFAKVWGYFWWGPQASWKENSIIDCTANISEFGEKVRVRVNFQVKVMNNKGGVDQVYQIDDAKYYQEFFSKVDKGIFIEKEKI